MASQDIKIISSNNSSIVIEYTPVVLDSSDITIDGLLYKNFKIKNAVYENAENPGMPQIPVRIINIGVPSEFGNTIQIMNSSFTAISGNVIPSPTAVKEDVSVNYQYILSEKYNDYKSSETASFGQFVYVRDLAVQKIKISPVQFDPVNKKIIYYNKIILKINFANGNVNNPINDKYLKDVVINFETAKNWGRTNTNLRKTNAVVNSVLAQGTWYKFTAPAEGMYKISRSELASIGIDAASVDPRTIKIYNNGGYVLPENPAISAASDLIENAILVVGQEDGRFDESDYILFYGRGINFWEFDQTSNDIIRRKHFYDKNNYFWITSGGTSGKRIEDKNSLNETNVFEQITTNAFAFVDDDKVNIARSGRVYYGDEFTPTNKTKTYINSLKNIVPDSNIKYSFSFANAAKLSRSFTIYENDVTVYSINISGASSDYEFGRLTKRSFNYRAVLPEDRSVLKINFDAKSNTSDAGYIDYIEIRYSKYLTAAGDSLIFFSADTNAVIKYTISNFRNSDNFVFDITDFSSVKRITNAEISGGQFVFQSAEAKGNISKYLAVNSAVFKQIRNPVKVDNSNIHGIAQGADYILITDKIFSEEAERYKSYRENESPYKLKVQIIYMDDIINEFSGGLADPTAIRNFIKYAYENWAQKPYYVLLFGDGTYDYLKTEGDYANYVYTYQSINSEHDVNSFTTDDYFARVSGNDSAPDVAIARLNIVSNKDANVIIDKIIDYEKNMEKGSWRNTITLVADDNITSKGIEFLPHTQQSEQLTDYVPKSFDIKKIYLAEYPTVITGLGRTKPAVTDAIVSTVNSGTLIMNYQGHGSPNLWAHENVFVRATTIPRLQNNKYFFLTAATCDFGNFDKPSSISAAEEMIFTDSRGMIGGFVSARPVYSAPNAELNEEFYSNLFPGNSATLEKRTIGQAYFLTKNALSRENDSKFLLMCDPALSLDAPGLPVQIDSVNGIQVNLNPIQIKALSTVSIDGSVRNSNNQIDNTFEGEGFVTVYDAQKIKLIKDLNQNVVKQGGVIFNGRVSIENGKFQTGFVVPKDITYENKNGKIVAYVFNDDYDGIGFTTNVIVGGTDTSVVNDNKGPEIEIYYDNLSFESSYLVNPDFKLLVKLNDETGLNTTGTGVGHKLEGILNDEVENPIDFSNSFIGDLNSGGKSGVIEYNFFDKEPGNYTIKIKAWDVFNNLSETESYFTVVSDSSLVLRNIVNYPNPFSSSTTFTFQQNLDQPFNVKIKIYTIAGRLIKEIEEHNIWDKFVKIPWDGRDEDGSVLANGTYFYKLVVETVDSRYKENILGKLAIIK